MTRTLTLLAILASTPAHALQCPDGTWRDKLEHCDLPPTVQCADGTWRDDARWCEESKRPQPRPATVPDQ